MNKMNYGCEGLCVVISGGTSGIGLAAAQRFLADGARVYILGRSEERGAQALCYLDEQTGKQAVYISCDVTKQAECKAAVAKIAEQTGYRDSGSLIRVFKKVTGMTPGQYKAAHSEE